MTIYVNRVLNMKQIKAIGFDMDHTLVRYQKKTFEELTYSEMKNKLVSKLNYPKRILELEFDHELTIRGLVIDKQNGNLIKISLHSRIKQAFHGTRQIDYKEMMALYRGEFIDLNDKRFEAIDTTFSVPYAVLFSQIVQLKTDYPQEGYPDYNTLEADLIDALDMSHRDGSLKGEVAKNVSKYIVKDEQTVRALERFKASGKKLWVITNSDYNYTKLLLDYAINPFLKDGKHWRDFFDLVITLAAKPRFFTEKLPFLQVDPETGLMNNSEGPFDKGLFQGGCAKLLQRDCGFSGEQILYLGDHIYGDILSLKKSCNWRTALVIEELEQEVEAFNKGASVLKKIESLMSEKMTCEKKLDELYAQEYENGLKIDKKSVDQEFEKIKQIDGQLSEQIKAYQAFFNPNWGEVMRSGQEASRFAGQVEKYACIYMSKVSNFIDYSPRTYFRPHKKVLPHEF